MDLQILVRLLWLRWLLRQRDHWTRVHLGTHQAQALEALRQHAYAQSRFYRRFHQGYFNQPLQELPILSKAALMENFDELVTDPAVCLKDVEAHLAGLKGNQRFLDRYWVSATSGSTGRRGIFLFDLEEWTTVLASYARSNAWGGARVGLTKRMKMAVVSTTTPWHQSAQVGATVQSWFVPTLRLDATDPLEHVVKMLNAFQPETLVAYASIARLLAAEQLAAKLHIAPHSVFTAAEVLTDESRRLIAKAWGCQPFNVYRATEAATIASECEHHEGMHLFEDLVITEVVDENYRPVPPGEYGAKVLVTVLFSRTLPLIRYEMSDSIRLTTRQCPCGRPYAMIDGIQGRLEEVLHMPALAGGKVAVHPNVFHDVIDLVPTGGWQVVLERDGLNIFMVGSQSLSVGETLTDSLQKALSARGASVPPITVHWVQTIPKNPLGKAPLVKSNLLRGELPRTGESPQQEAGP